MDERLPEQLYRCRVSHDKCHCGKIFPYTRLVFNSPIMATAGQGSHRCQGVDGKPEKAKYNGQMLRIEAAI